MYIYIYTNTHIHMHIHMYSTTSGDSNINQNRGCCQKEDGLSWIGNFSAPCFKQHLRCLFFHGQTQGIQPLFVLRGLVEVPEVLGMGV